MAEQNRKNGTPMPQRQYKDTIFRMLYKDKNHLLSLYNALNKTAYTDPDELIVNTLENAVYLAMKNDISCILDLRLNLYEHQSTVNLNMPLRNLFYVARLYEKMIPEEKLYARRPILLPAPKFIVFYNGEEKQPEQRELRLSDSYMTEDEETNLELVVLQLNINSGYNAVIKESCRTLKEYMQYVERVRTYAAEMPLQMAVEKAVTECIGEGILEKFLRENRKEVISMSIFEYDEEKHLKTVREEGYEDGYEEAFKQAKYKIVSNMLKKNQLPDVISECTEVPLEYVYQVEQEMASCLREQGKGYDAGKKESK